MRNPDGYHGRCGYCEFRKVCGGCRARAFAFTGDYLAEEPFCLYEPKGRGGREGKARQGREGKARQGREGKARQGREPSGGELDELDKRILSVIQVDFPVAARPFDVLAERLSVPAEQALERTARLVGCGVMTGLIFVGRITMVYLPRRSSWGPWSLSGTRGSVAGVRRSLSARGGFIRWAISARKAISRARRM